MDIDLLDDSLKYHYYIFNILNKGVCGTGVLKTTNNFFSHKLVSEIFYDFYKNNRSKYEIGDFKEIKEEEYYNMDYYKNVIDQQIWEKYNCEIQYRFYNCA